uniref:tRNA modification GTPase MnmE n=1 Tax=Lygus hesperus TaxID=30085 RepID=A0A0A9W818_LYGHE
MMMKLAACYCLLAIVAVVSAYKNYTDYEDGAGLSAEDLKIIKSQFALLAKKGKVAKAENVLRAMVTYEGRYIKYIIAYEGQGQICSGRITRRFNSQKCITNEMRAMCQDNTEW